MTCQAYIEREKGMKGMVGQGERKVKQVRGCFQSFKQVSEARNVVTGHEMK
jgi:hypothetical protein